MAINRVLISGNLTREPELRMTQGGTQVLNFGVAVNDRVRDPNTGEYEDRPNFVDVVVFGARAERLSQYLTTGMKVAIDGALRFSQWTTQAGEKRSRLEVVATQVEFMSRAGSAEVVRTIRPEQPAQPSIIPDDDIPF